MMKLMLNGGWRLDWCPANPQRDYANRPIRNLIDIDVPGDIHQALMKSGIIPDPQLVGNAAKIDWTIDQEWWFYRDFTVSEYELKKPSELVFEGLDLQADVWINGIYSGRHINAFRPFRIELTQKLKNHNTIAVRLLPFRNDLDRLSGLDMVTEDDRPFRIRKNGIYLKRPWMRKPQYVFGWNWTWYLATCGITGNVYLNIYDSPVIDNPAVFTDSLTDNSAILTFIGNIKYFDNPVFNGNINIKISKRNKKRIEAEFNQPLNLTSDTASFVLSGKLKDPALWWPVGMGKQNLYQATFSLEDEHGVLHTETVTFGVRTIKVDESPRKRKDAWKFRFIINGHPVFIKGANWVPPDTCYARVTSEKRRKLLEMAKECNLNYLRVWGGGIYEPDEFYDLCDKLGIMVWQDFMFSCAEYPDFDAEFHREVKLEVDHQTKRLRNHPSLIMWCGNNEIEQQKFVMRELRPEGNYYGECLFKEMIPDWLVKLDNSRPYISSSGFTTNLSHTAIRPTTFDSGIIHHDIFPELIKRGPKKIPSFLGEWYTASPPTNKTIAQFLPEKHRNWQDKIWQMHDFVSSEFIERVDRYVAPLRHLDFKKSLYYFHCLQMEMNKTGMELCRKHLWECSGNVIWMFADAFNGFTRTIIDYYCRRKPAFHALKRACTPIIAVAEDLGDFIEISVVNEFHNIFKGNLSVTNYTFTGDKLASFDSKVDIAGNSAKVCQHISRNKLGNNRESFLWMKLVDLNGNVINENRMFLDHLINLKFPLTEPQIAMNNKDGKTIVTIISDKLVRNFRVEAEVPEDMQISDNWFDICPGEIKRIEIIDCGIPDKLKCIWENRELGIEKIISNIGEVIYRDKTGAAAIPVEIFNPASDRSMNLAVHAELPEPWGKSRSFNFTVKPGNTVEANLPLYIRPGSLSTDTEIICNCAGEIISRREKVNLAPPWTLKLQKSINGLSALIESNCNKHFSRLELKILYETNNNVREQIIELVLPPFGQKCIELNDAEYKIVTTLLCSKNKILARDTYVADSFVNSLTVIPPTGLFLADRISDFAPAILNRAGYRIQGNGMQTVFFMSFTENAFYFDVVMSGEMLENPVVEIALASGRSFGFEAAYFSLEGNAHKNIRRNNGTVDNIQQNSMKYLSNKELPSWQPRNSTVTQLHEKAVLFRCIIPWNHIKQNYIPTPGDEIGFASVFNYNPRQYLKIFEGIHGIKNHDGYGRIKLHDPKSKIIDNSQKICIKYE